MVKGDNKGHKYEKKIVGILQNKGLMPVEISGAGSGPGVDAFFTHKGKKYSVEVSFSLLIFFGYNPHPSTLLMQ